MHGKRKPRRVGGFSGNRLALQPVSGQLLRLKGDIHERLQVVEIERGAVKSGASLTLEQAQQVRRKEWAILADVLPDRRFDVASSQRSGRSFG